MNETQRQAYLKTMGIQSYFPRVVLSGAKASPQYEFSQEPVVEPIKPQAAQIQKGSARNSTLDEMRSRNSSARASAVSQVREAPAKRATEAEMAPPKQVAASGVAEPNIPQAEQEELRFSFNYYRIGASLAVISEVPHQNNSTQSAEATTLMKKILTALSVNTDEMKLGAETFTWPLAVDLGIEGDSAEQAARALKGFMQVRHEKDRFANLLVFAGRLEQLLIRGDSSRHDFKEAAGNYNVTVTQSVYSMLVHPALKKEVWQDLQPLLARLTTAS